jgi:hypothetical protein
VTRLERRCCCARGGQCRSIGGFRRAEHGEPSPVDGAGEFDRYRSDQREDRSHVQEVCLEVIERLIFDFKRRGNPAAFFFPRLIDAYRRDTHSRYALNNELAPIPK